MTTREITGWHVAAWFGLAFGTIIAVNIVLAVNAVRSFPGLEVKNSYVASQVFDRQKQSQLQLNWDVSAYVSDDELVLSILKDNQPIAPEITRAVFGRATSVAQDQEVQFVFDGNTLRAPVQAGPGNWNLRLSAISDDGTLFQQRIVIRGGL